MAIWRPPNWNNPYAPSPEFNAFEEGADAMLEALKKELASYIEAIIGASKERR